MERKEHSRQVIDLTTEAMGKRAKTGMKAALAA